MIDTFAAVVHFWFQIWESTNRTELRAKTYDLKSAYPQVSIRKDHLKHAYFAVYSVQS